MAPVKVRSRFRLRYRGGESNSGDARIASRAEGFAGIPRSGRFHEFADLDFPCPEAPARPLVSPIFMNCETASAPIQVGVCRIPQSSPFVSDRAEGNGSRQNAGFGSPFSLATGPAGLARRSGLRCGIVGVLGALGGAHAFVVAAYFAWSCRGWWDKLSPIFARGCGFIDPKRLRTIRSRFQDRSQTLEPGHPFFSTRRKETFRTAICLTARLRRNERYVYRIASC